MFLKFIFFSFRNSIKSAITTSSLARSEAYINIWDSCYLFSQKGSIIDVWQDSQYSVDTGRKLNVHKTSWASSERIMYVQFMFCVYWARLNMESSEFHLKTKILKIKKGFKVDKKIPQNLVFNLATVLNLKENSSSYRALFSSTIANLDL